MKLFAYVDESGTFDKKHCDLFVYGGIVIAGSDNMQEMARRYLAIEREVRREFGDRLAAGELKAHGMPRKCKRRIFKALDMPWCQRFGIVVDLGRVYDSTFASKVSKQRFMDYALKRSVKCGVLGLLAKTGSPASSVDFLKVTVDEHTSATDGRYNLAESIDEEFRHGMYSFGSGYPSFHPPVFPGMSKIPVVYADSSVTTLVRAADVVANWVYCAARDEDDRPEIIGEFRRTCSFMSAF